MCLVCRTIGLSDYRTVGLLDRRTIGMSDYRSDPYSQILKNYNALVNIAWFFLSILSSLSRILISTRYIHIWVKLNQTSMTKGSKIRLLHQRFVGLEYRTMAGCRIIGRQGHLTSIIGPLAKQCTGASTGFPYRLSRLKPRASTSRGPLAKVYNICVIVNVIDLSYVCTCWHKPSVIFLALHFRILISRH